MLFGVGLGDLLAGLPLDADGDFTGSFLDLLTPYGLFLGVVLLTLCLLHGSTFLTIRSTGVVQWRARTAGRRMAVPAAALVAGFVVWTYVLARPGVWPALALVVPLVAVVAAGVLVLGSRSGAAAFAATAVAVGGVVAALFANLYPRLLVSTTDAANTLTVANSTAASYSLTVMTVVAAVMVPLVLLYQGWTYYVFRARVVGPPHAVRSATTDRGPTTSSPSVTTRPRRPGS